MASISEGTLFGMGNPLLDIQANVENVLLEKYGLTLDGVILSEEKHAPLFKEMMDNHKPSLIAGGATQNSMRVAQWILGGSKAVTFMGCIGSDEYGKLLQGKVKESGVNALYQVNDKVGTGRCAALIVGANRSLVTDLGAANTFSHDHLTKHMEIMKKAKFYYISGFFLTVSPASMIDVGKHASATNKVFMLNLSAPFISQFFKDPLLQVLPYVDILFGNESEAAQFSKEQNLGTEKIEEIAKKIQAMSKDNKKRDRVVIITQGCDPVVVADSKGVKTYSVTKLSKEQLVDTNGAGDAFVGGFLSQLVQGKSHEDCIRAGNWAANVIIQRSGCTFPDKCEFK